MLDWLIRHHPSSAAHVIGEIVGEADRRLGIPRPVSERSIRTALVLDGKLEETVREEFLERVLTGDSLTDLARNQVSTLCGTWPARDT